MTLSAHAKGARYVTDERIIKAVPAPPFTDTWHPWSHGDVIEALQHACDLEGIDVLRRQYSLGWGDHMMFGTWGLDLGGNGEMGYELGFRNSTNKQMKVGVCAGTNVFVCDNMAFSGSFILFRMHTSGLDLDELYQIAQTAVQGAVVEMRKMHDWHKNLRTMYVPAPYRKQMTYDFITQDVFPPRDLKNYLGCVEEEMGLLKSDAAMGYEGDTAVNLHAIHGGVTRLLRGTNLLTLSKRTGKLEKIIDQYAADGYLLNQAA